MLIDRYLRDAIEVDVDAICDGTDVAVCRRAPAYRGSRRPFGRQRLLDPAVQPVATRSSGEIERQTRELALALKVRGLMNVQYAVKGRPEVYLIEVNPRASRTVPFVAKATGKPIAKMAARVMAGEPLAGSARYRAPSIISRSRSRYSRSRASPNYPVLDRK